MKKTMLVALTAGDPVGSRSDGSRQSACSLNRARLNNGSVQSPPCKQVGAPHTERLTPESHAGRPGITTAVRAACTSTPITSPPTTGMPTGSISRTAALGCGRGIVFQL